VAKDPLARDDIGVPRRRHEIPSIVAEESMILLSHSLEPVGILERRTCRGGNRRVPVDKSMQIKPLTGMDMYVVGVARAMHERPVTAHAPVKAARRAPASGVVGLCGTTGGTMIDRTSSRNS
jgi:hypothetical protein